MVMEKEELLQPGHWKTRIWFSDKARRFSKVVHI
jgi:hypothetical protein